MTTDKKAGQLTDADVKALWAAGDWQGIAEARRDGRLRVLMGEKSEDVAFADKAATARLTRADVRRLTDMGRGDLVAAAAREARIDYTNDPGPDAA